MSSSNDEWRPVYGLEGLYEVTRNGEVRRSGKAARSGKGRGGGARIGRLLKPQVNWANYVFIQFWQNGKNKLKLLHVVVMEAFVGPKPAGMDVNHKDGVKGNNTLENLEYVTRSENMLHAYATGLRRQPTKLDAKKQEEVRALYATGTTSSRRLAAQFGTTKRVILNCVNRQGPYAKEQAA